ncbi:MAG: immune inhibitor A [Acidimicrobiales bacterium]|nr:immune inhibitor A [Acidimicrobiales bacterium]
MKRRISAIVTVGVLVSGLGITSAGAAPDRPQAPGQEAGDDRYDVYVGKLDRRELEVLRASGIDPHDLGAAAAGGGQFDVEVVVSGDEAEELADQGIDLELKEVDGESAAEMSTRLAQAGHAVFRPYGGPGGLKEEFEQIAADNPAIAELVVIGQTVEGQDIVALKVTRNATRVPDGRRPATLFSAAQHAREWITPEMVRRLAHHVVDGYGTDQAITDVVDRTELWFVPVANPDGYDWTFEPGQRLWRKNLADNNGDGQIAPGDGVDLNRNFPTRWGYDNEGSSPQQGSQTYRGTAPSSEPETAALDGLMDRVGFEFLINYHSAAELLLYGTGWQVSTPTPDDAVYEAMVGDDEEPAVPGYDPDISAELYTTNGETTEHAHTAYDTLAFTPEMSTCQTASAVDPEDEWDPGDCGSVFHFPDDEGLVQAEFEKNLPFALATAQSALDPDDPVSVVDREVPDFVVDSFAVSYGDPQPVAVTARRAQLFRWMNYSIDGGPVRRSAVSEWQGGERYGDEGDSLYGEFRGTVEGAAPGDSVEVWFQGFEPGRGFVESERFTYVLESDTDASALIIANEDYTGVNPTYPAGTTAPKHADAYAAALDANGVSHATFDVDAQGVPHHLGVLGHFDAVVWEMGDNRLTQDPEDEITDTYLFGPLPDLAVAERQQYLTLAVRDYLNEGGKLVHTGETTGYFGLLGGSIGGIYYGLDGAPEDDCVISEDFFSDCLLLADDFHQYYLGAYARATFTDPGGIAGTGTPLDGAAASFGGPAVADNPLDEAGAFALTSDALPPDEFPLFAGTASSTYVTADGRNPFGPAEGERYAGAVHADASWMRLARTVDLTGVAAADAPALEFQISFSTELGYDNVIVEAKPGDSEDDWTTLPEASGATSTTPPTECEAGFLLAMHPFLEHYLTGGDPCSPTGSTGEWNALTGESGGWQDVAFDLSAYAGGTVDLKISYVTDPASGGIGVFVDDTRITTSAGDLDADGFEGDTSLWAIEGAPPGSGGNLGDFVISTVLVEVAASVTTEDSVLLGYGIEQLATPAEQADVLGRIMQYLLG